MIQVTAGERPLREVNAEIRAALATDDVEVLEPLSRHNLGVALTGDSTRHALTVRGSVGYYAGGLNNGGRMRIEGNAGWGLGEAQAAGHIEVTGWVGMSVGASMRGGLLHVRGDAGPRAGVAMKGGDIVVEGEIGFLSCFMGHAGRLICLGDAGDATGDSLWGGCVWVAGRIASPGTDSKIVEPSVEEVDEVEGLLATLELADTSRDWKKIVSAERLWHFDKNDAKSWLLI